MITLNFNNNRNDKERFVMRINQSYTVQKSDFVEVTKHGITDVKLIGDGVNMSTSTGEISLETVPVFFDRETFEGTEFTITPNQETLNNIGQSKTLELLINNETIADINVQVK